VAGNRAHKLSRPAAVIFVGVEVTRLISILAFRFSVRDSSRRLLRFALIREIRVKGRRSFLNFARPRIQTALVTSRVNFRKNLALLLFSVLMLTGCGTTVMYKSNTPASLAKPVGYPISVYTEGMIIPRPFEVVGTVSVKNSGLTVVGGSVDDVMKKVMQNAREKGADAVRMAAIEKPDFMNPNYRMAADLLRYTDSWETVAISEEKFLAYLKKNVQTLDPIEGVWFADGQYQNRIGIMKNTSKPGRNFIGFVLNTEVPSWREGYKKIDIARGKQRGTYSFNYYRDDFGLVVTTVILGDATGFMLIFQTADKNESITYSKLRIH
jgi:hypothetical protein